MSRYQHKTAMATRAGPSVISTKIRDSIGSSFLPRHIDVCLNMIKIAESEGRVSKETASTLRRLANNRLNQIEDKMR